MKIVLFQYNRGASAVLCSSSLAAESGEIATSWQATDCSPTAMKTACSGRRPPPCAPQSHRNMQYRETGSESLWLYSVKTRAVHLAFFFLKKELKNISWQFDKTVKGNKSRNRPTDKR